MTTPLSTLVTEAVTTTYLRELTQVGSRKRPAVRRIVLEPSRPRTERPTLIRGREACVGTA